MTAAPRLGEQSGMSDLQQPLTDDGDLYGPIVDAPFALRMAAFGLRRFTLAELVHASRVPEADALEWLVDNAAMFAVWVPGPVNGAGTGWRMSAEAEEACRREMEAMTPLQHHVRMYGGWRQRVDRIQALDWAESYLGFVEDADTPETRATALSWAADWVRSAAEVLASHGEVESVVDPSIPPRVAEARVRLARLSA